MWRHVIALNVVGLLWGVVIILGLPITVALVGTAMAVATLVMMFFIEKARANKGAKDLEAALGAQADAYSSDARPDQQIEIEDMRNQFLKELGALKASKLGGGGLSALYHLPWYMIIGPPGAGKSTALKNSGLNFPSRSGGIKGIGGTRNCDWWLTNEAVILDTAGRYTSEDEDHDEWVSFLDIIRKHRKKKPINGLIVAVSVTDLGGHEDDEIERLAGGIRRRVDEVVERLQMVVPIYLLFTKCDLIPGFNETFGTLRKKDRGQIWGATFRLDQPAGRQAELFEEQVDELGNILWRRMYARIEDERRVEAREHIYQFPQQFDALRASLTVFVDNLFAPDVYGQPPIMRGVYLTSGTQEGSPIDLLTSSMAEAFGIERDTGDADAQLESKSYFLRDVFANVMFPDQDVAARSAKGQRAIVFRRIAIGAGAFVSSALLTILPLEAYLQNVDVVNSTDNMIQEIVAERQANKDKVIPPKSLMTLRHRLSEYKQWEADSPPVAMRFGMYQGNELFPYVRRFYVQTLQKELLEPIIRHDIDEMNTLRQVYGFNSRPSDQEYKRFFDKLKIHLLLTAPHEKSEPPLQGDEEAWLVEQITGRWGLALQSDPDPEEQREMAKDVEFYVELLQHDPLMAMGRNVQATLDTRNMLNRVSYAEAIIKQVIAETSTQDRDLNLRRIMGGAVTPIESDRSVRVRAAYTRWGWDSVVKGYIDAAGAQSDRWVFGLAADKSSSEFIAELHGIYFKQYVEEWSAFIDSLRIKQPADINDALTMLRDLTRGSPPPLKRLMQAVHENTAIYQPEEKGLAAKAADSGFLNKIANKLKLGKAGRMAANAAKGGGGTGLLNPLAVQRTFEGFSSFGYLPPPPPKEGEPPPPPETVPADVLLEEMAFLRDALQTYLEDPRTAADLMSKLQAARTAAQGLIGALEVGSGWRPKLEALIWPPFEFVQSSLSGMKAETSRAWCSDVVSPYVRSLKGRYPFANKHTETTIADVSAFFAPDSGILWGFYNKQLAGDILQTGSRFKFDNRLGGMVKKSYTGNILPYLKKALTVTRNLYPPGSQDPTLSLDVRILADAAFSVITLDIGGEAFDYRGGPELWKRITWPAGDPVQGATLRLKGRGGVEDSLKFAGEWGLWRLLEGGTVVKGKGHAFTLKWTSKRLKAEVKLDVRTAGSKASLIKTAGKGRKKSLRLSLGDVTPPYTIAKGAGGCTP